MAIYSLIVGINQYAGSSVSNLGGCHNDAERVANVLKTRYLAHEDNMQMLLSEQASKANIVAGFQQHLAQAGKDDTAIFYYSGHGSQEKAPKEFWDIEPDHQNETLVCHDSRTGAGDLADKELRFLISQVAANGAKVVLLLDCCHSGNATRTSENDADLNGITSVRLTGQGSVHRKIEDYLFYDTAKQEGWLDDLTHMPEGEHIVMSGCQDSELSKELNINHKRHGAFTHYLCETLENTQYSLSYANLLNKVKLQVRNLVDKQNPDLFAAKSANTDEVFLSNDIQPLRLSIYVKNHQWYVDAGLIHSMEKGDQLAIFSEQQNTNDSDQIPIATADISEVNAEKSLLTLSDENAQTLDQNTVYYTRVSQRSVPPLNVAFIGDDAGTIPAITAMSVLTMGKPSSWLEETVPEDCDYRLVAHNNRYQIMPQDEDRPLFASILDYGEDSATKALHQLEHVARWQRKLRLINNGSRIPNDAVELVLTYKGQELTQDEINLSYEQNNGDWQAPDIKLAIRYNTESEYNKPVFCSVLWLNPLDMSVTEATEGKCIELRPKAVFENDAGSLLKRAKVDKYPLFDDSEMSVEVDDNLFYQGITQTRDMLKLIISETPFNIKLLEQNGLETYDPIKEAKSVNRSTLLQSMLEETLRATHTRKLVRKSKKQPDWVTRTVTIKTHRPLDTTRITNNKSTDLGLGVSIEAHDINASVSLESSSQSQAGRSADSPVFKTTPDCFTDATQSSAFAFSSSRSANTSLDTLVIQADSDSELQNKLSETTPLVVNIDTALNADEHILPYVSDGEFFYPVGFTEKSDSNTRVLIQGLPDIESIPTATQGKGLGKTIKVFFQKIVYDKLRLEKEEIHQLSIAKLDDQGNITEQTGISEATDEVKNAERILLLIHGIAGESKYMSGCLGQQHTQGTALSSNYDLVLTFDYESLNTIVQDSANLLKKKLEAVGLGDNHGKHLDIIALDLGGLITRWMIEREECANRVNNLVLVGVPNKGTPWATFKEQGYTAFKSWAYGSLTLMLNNLTVIPIGGVAVAGMVKLLEAADNTLDQMNPESELLKALATSSKPSTQYFVISGSTSKLMVELEDEEKGKISRAFEYLMKRSKLVAFDLMTSKIFKQDNDFAFSVESMSGLPASFCDDSHTSEIQADHFSYFSNKDCIKQIQSALA